MKSEVVTDEGMTIMVMLHDASQCFTMLHGASRYVSLENAKDNFNLFGELSSSSSSSFCQVEYKEAFCVSM